MGGMGEGGSNSLTLGVLIDLLGVINNLLDRRSWISIWGGVVGCPSTVGGVLGCPSSEGVMGVEGVMGPSPSNIPVFFNLCLGGSTSIDGGVLDLH